MSVQIPKELMENELYSRMSNGAKMLYGILANLKKEAERNEWIDEKGCRYVIFPKKRMQEELNCSRYSADLFMRELEVLDLIRLGYCITPIIQRRIYVRNLEDVEVLLASYMVKRPETRENADLTEQNPKKPGKNKTPDKETEKKDDVKTKGSGDIASGKEPECGSDSIREEVDVKEILNLAETLTRLVCRMFEDDEIEKA